MLPCVHACACACACVCMCGDSGWDAMTSERLWFSFSESHGIHDHTWQVEEFNSNQWRSLVCVLRCTLPSLGRLSYCVPADDCMIQLLLAKFSLGYCIYCPLVLWCRCRDPFGLIPSSDINITATDTSHFPYISLQMHLPASTACSLGEYESTESAFTIVKFPLNTEMKHNSGDLSSWWLYEYPTNMTSSRCVQICSDLYR